jgi:hypothetical protein
VSLLALLATASYGVGSIVSPGPQPVIAQEYQTFLTLNDPAEINPFGDAADAAEALSELVAGSIDRKERKAMLREMAKPPLENDPDWTRNLPQPELESLLGPGRKVEPALASAVLSAVQVLMNDDNAYAEAFRTVVGRYPKIVELPLPVLISRIRSYGNEVPTFSREDHYFANTLYFDWFRSYKELARRLQLPFPHEEQGMIPRVTERGLKGLLLNTDLVLRRKTLKVQALTDESRNEIETAIRFMQRTVIQVGPPKVDDGFML